MSFRNVISSVAQMVFNDANFLVLCTGSLVADSDSSTQTPWFYSANHCFDNENLPVKTATQMQTVANTIDQAEVRTRQIERKLKDVEAVPGADAVQEDLQLEEKPAAIRPVVK